MVHINRIYTRKGDHGATQLLDGTQVAKHHDRLEVSGTIDELNAAIGAARAEAATRNQTVVSTHLAEIQQELFDLGAQISAGPTIDPQQLPRITAEQIQQLEQWIDEITKQLPQLQSFVLPGSTPLHAQLHLARTIARRAERTLVRLDQTETVPSLTLAYLNRLSDFLFAAARIVVKDTSDSELLWNSRRNNQ